MKNYNLILILFIFLFGVSSCSEGFLEVDPKATQIESNYYKNAEEVFNGLVAAYDPISWEGTNGYANIGCWIAASDDALGGGGGPSDVPYLNTMDDFRLDAANGPQAQFWEKNFRGVSRVNTLLEKMTGDIDGLTESLRNRYVAELKFLRAFYYFDLVRQFGNVPLFTSSLPTNEFYEVVQSEPEEVYTQIIKDLTEAVSSGALADQIPTETEGGRVTQGAALALLGKVYLYHGDFAEAAQQLAIVNGSLSGQNRFGYQLLEDFGKIFRPDNKFSSESIFEIGHTNIAASGWGNHTLVEGLILQKMTEPRSYSGPVYYAGWGGCPISLELVDVMKNDPRSQYTYTNVDSLAKAGSARYIAGYENTGYFMLKYAPLQEFLHTGAGPHPLNYNQNFIEIRLADTYLMEAEALVKSDGNTTRAGELLNAVRGRVGLPAIEATFENIIKERRLELATEGHRFFDLVRTGKAIEFLGSSGFVSNKNEILPIPLAELTNTLMVQNPNY